MNNATISFTLFSGLLFVFNCRRCWQFLSGTALHGTSALWTLPVIPLILATYAGYFLYGQDEWKYCAFLTSLVNFVLFILAEWLSPLSSVRQPGQNQRALQIYQPLHGGQTVEECQQIISQANLTPLGQAEADELYAEVLVRKSAYVKSILGLQGFVKELTVPVQ
jgi:hypothetical protein